MKCRDQFKTLPDISKKLGTSFFFGGNGDFLWSSIQIRNVEGTRGPVITQRIDFNLYHNFDKERAFIMEDASYPNMVAWFAEGRKPGFMKVSCLTE